MTKIETRKILHGRLDDFFFKFTCEGRTATLSYYDDVTPRELRSAALVSPKARQFFIDEHLTDTARTELMQMIAAEIEQRPAGWEPAGLYMDQVISQGVVKFILKNWQVFRLDRRFLEKKFGKQFTSVADLL